MRWLNEQDFRKSDFELSLNFIYESSARVIGGRNFAVRES